MEPLEPRLLLDGVPPVAPADGLDPAGLAYDPAWIADPPDQDAAPLSTPPPGTADWSGVLDVYVEAGLLAWIQDALNTYVADLTLEGYTVSVQEWTGSAEALRTQLQGRYAAADLEGAVFVGDLPTLTFTHDNDFYGNTVSFIHDLYFMDLDGTYVLNDTDPDEHLDGSGDIEPEIYVSRISPAAIADMTGRSEVELINDYFAKAHAYRAGGLTYKDRGIVWSDDDWNSNASAMGGTALYDEILVVNDDAETTKQSYIDCLQLNYESMLDKIHSGATSHSIQGVGWGTVRSTDIYALNPRQGFYNLWNCSSGDFTVRNNLICTYVYSGDYGLNAVGSTKTGSMLNTPYYYEYQGEGDSVGQAFFGWWNRVDNHSDNYKSWHYGMTMQGDPTLRPDTMGSRIVFADAGSDQQGVHGEQVTLDGSGSHAASGGDLDYLWQQVSGPEVDLSGADQVTATFTAAWRGTYVFRLTVTDGEAVDSDEVTITVADRVVFAMPGHTQEGAVGREVVLDGSESYAVSGNDLLYAWQQVSGPAVELSGADEAIATFVPTEVGTYIFELTVQDGGAMDSGEVRVVVVAAARPTGVDLLPESDTGQSATDNWTYLDNAGPAAALKFNVLGTIPGATVTLYATGTPIGSAVADGETTLIVTDGATHLDDRVHKITARQQEPGKEQSADSRVLWLVVDTVGPAPESVEVISAQQLLLRFNESLAAESAGTAGNYQLDDGPAIQSAVRDYDQRVVVLALAEGMTGSGTRTLTVNHVEDWAGNPNSPDAQVTFEFHEVDPALLAWWTFDDGAGEAAADASGNGRDADVLGADWADGRLGGALHFDGIDDYVLDDDGEDYLNGLSAVTVAMWVKSEVVHTERGFFTTRDPGSSSCLNIRYDDRGYYGGADDTIKAYVRTDASGTGQYEGESGVQGTDWQHVALTWSDGAIVTLYVDGVAQELTHDTGALDGVLDGATKIIVGMGYKPTDGAWQGLIDDVRIYSRALAAEEIAQLANLEPVARDDAYEMEQGDTLYVYLPETVLGNDTDPDGGPEPLTAWRVTGPWHGGLTLEASGAFEYWPTQDFVGTDTFTYRAYDGLGYSTQATVTIAVIDSTAPVVTVDPLVTLDTTPALGGTVDDPDAAIEVTVGGKTYTAVNLGGTWALPDDTIDPALAAGTYDVQVAATDAAGNTGHDDTTEELTILEPARIGGRKFHDLDEDGPDAGEPGLEGWRIYIDLNNSGTWEEGEPFDLTGPDGGYLIEGLLPGTYVVREAGRTGWRQTYPVWGSYEVPLAAGQSAGGIDFGNWCLPGDTDLDGDVDFADYAKTKGNFGMLTGASRSDGDFDYDGDVDFRDYTAAKGNFGRILPAGGAQVPDAAVHEARDAAATEASEGPTGPAVASPAKAARPGRDKTAGGAAPAASPALILQGEDLLSDRPVRAVVERTASEPLTGAEPENAPAGDARVRLDVLSLPEILRLPLAPR